MAKDPKTEHMAKRQAAGLSYRDVADEFGTSKSTVGRKLKPKKDGFGKPIKPFSIKDGFTKLGPAR